MLTKNALSNILFYFITNSILEPISEASIIIGEQISIFEFNKSINFVIVIECNNFSLV